MISNPFDLFFRTTRRIYTILSTNKVFSIKFSFSLLHKLKFEIYYLDYLYMYSKYNLYIRFNFFINRFIVFYEVNLLIRATTLKGNYILIIKRYLILPSLLGTFVYAVNKQSL